MSFNLADRIGARSGASFIRPKDLEQRYNITATTRWRWEGAGKLPARDVHIGGKAVGWRHDTIESAERGPAATV